MTTCSPAPARPTSIPEATAAVSTGTSPAALRALALRDAASVGVGLVTFGMALGVTISVLHFGTLPGLFGTAAVFGGSAQLAAVTVVHQGAGVLAVVLSSAVVNTRLMLYSASLSSRFEGQPTWFRWLAPHFIIDQTYLLATARPELDQREFRRYWGWLGLAVLVMWFSSVAISILAAPLLPTMPDLGFAATALFVGLLVPRLTTRPAVAAALAGATVGAATGLIRPELGIICGAVAGVAAGSAVQR